MGIEKFYEQFIVLKKERVSDGMGGFKITYTEKGLIYGVVSATNSTEMRIAEQQGNKILYSFNTRKDSEVEYQNFIKRVSDNSCYRITSNSADLITPKMSRMNFKVLYAEKIELIEQQ